MRNKYFIEVMRTPNSRSFERSGVHKSKYHKNNKNNCRDIFRLYKDEEIIFICNIQSISNHPDFPEKNSLTGSFDFEVYAKKRGNSFEIPDNELLTRIHLIKNVYNENHEFHKEDGTTGNNYRTLFHSKWHEPLKKDTKAYSGGCFISSSNDLKRLNKKLNDEKLKEGDTIPGKII